MSTDPASASDDVAGAAYREAHAASEGDEMAQQMTDSVDAEERAREQAMGEVSDVLTNLDYALERARMARERIRKSGAHPNAEAATKDLVDALQAERKRFVQQTYFSVPNKTRMF